MTKFEDVLLQYEPMISASIRKLNIYRDHDSFRQSGRVALWQAWTRFDKEKGNFTPYAYRSIRGAMLDELKRENRFEENTSQMEDEILKALVVTEDFAPTEWSDQLDNAFKTLTHTERELIQWLFVEELTLAECAKKAAISLSGIKKRRHRMLVKLRGILEE
ncbi:sigma-70 family RNA polymerase sigma factor [Sporosarcina sp. G11-34]|uniref:sigma-70 family RNA polymerase sigma factor n=1 Tax=Sporosarcina sp. G11-34 TaxID=2849605 RepID=UPI0022A91A59|nr:sigma-70 family RNA polymerase sigma factor [Sporosarcina sp. G11-34]MCZ2257338.1 sigma-70 family RNA polymerase sigma factor [Sporosarcina sp. G11-34]